LIGFGIVIVIAAIGMLSAPQQKSSHPTTAAVSSSGRPTAVATHPSADVNGIGHAEDVELGPCAKDAKSGLYSAKVTVTNHSSKLSNYIVEISILSPDKATKYDDMLVLVNGLAPEQRSPQTPHGTRTDIPDDLVCELTEVTRFAA
jgi:hypothetical protein